MSHEFRYRQSSRAGLCAGAAILALIAGCATPPPPSSTEKPKAEAPGTAIVLTTEQYKKELARRITEINAARIYPGRPQALLRSVVVVQYVIDEQGRLVRSEIMRSNRDRQTESTALASLRQAAPFPRPPFHLARNGGVEIIETWLFNNDGRFQLRTLALAQMSE